MDEVERREHTKTAKRDLRLEAFAIIVEILVVVLICFEIRGSDQQLNVLQTLNSSADKTARTLDLVQKAQEGTLQTLQATLQPQVDLLKRHKN
jgi:hypothetical protein